MIYKTSFIPFKNTEVFLLKRRLKKLYQQHTDIVELAKKEIEIVTLSNTWTRTVMEHKNEPTVVTRPIAPTLFFEITRNRVQYDKAERKGKDSYPYIVRHAALCIAEIIARSGGRENISHYILEPSPYPLKAKCFLNGEIHDIRIYIITRTINGYILRYDDDDCLYSIDYLDISICSNSVQNERFWLLNRKGTVYDKAAKAPNYKITKNLKLKKNHTSQNNKEDNFGPIGMSMFVLFISAVLVGAAAMAYDISEPTTPDQDIEMPIIYTIEGRELEITPDKIDAFERDAQPYANDVAVHYEIDGERYAIPLSEREAFLKAYPNARLYKKTKEPDKIPTPTKKALNAPKTYRYTQDYFPFNKKLPKYQPPSLDVNFLNSKNTQRIHHPTKQIATDRQLITGSSPYNDYEYWNPTFDYNSQSTITFLNYSQYDYVVILYDIDTNLVIRNYYIQNGDSYTITHIPEGRYKLKMYSGLDWNSGKSVGGKLGGFERDPMFSKTDKHYDFIISFTTRQVIEEHEVYEYIEYPEYTMTLHPVSEGNVHTKRTTESDFFK